MPSRDGFRQRQIQQQLYSWTSQAAKPSGLSGTARVLSKQSGIAKRYELLLHRCPGIVEHLPLNAIASFLCITPQMLSKIRKDITFDAQQ